MTLSIYEQQRRMRLRWSDFEVLERTKSRIHWEGQLRPNDLPHQVEVLYELHRGSSSGSSMPEVTVTDPLLHRRSSQPEQPIPHVYVNRHAPHLPLLCLYDPVSDEWHAGLSIADTIVPWTAEWLWRYEFWLRTGIWPEPDRAVAVP